MTMSQNHGTQTVPEAIAGIAGCLFRQWPFQEPKLEVPTIYKAYFSGLNFREDPHKIWPNIWYVYVPP